MSWIQMGLLSIPAELSIVFHEEEPIAERGWMNGRVTNAVAFRLDAKGLSATVLRSCQITHATVWWGERLFSVATVTIDWTVQGDWANFNEGSFKMLARTYDDAGLGGTATGSVA